MKQHQHDVTQPVVEVKKNRCRWVVGSIICTEEDEWWKELYGASCAFSAIRLRQKVAQAIIHSYGRSGGLSEAGVMSVPWPHTIPMRSPSWYKVGLKPVSLHICIENNQQASEFHFPTRLVNLTNLADGRLVSLILSRSVLEKRARYMYGYLLLGVADSL